MISLKTWTHKNANRPLAWAIGSVLCLQVSYLAYMARAEYAAELGRIERVVETASLGMQQSNRPLVESAITAGLQESDGARISLCRNGSPILQYPPSTRNPCAVVNEGLLAWAVRKPAIGIEGYTFVFNIDVLHTFGPTVILGSISASLFLVIALVLGWARRRFQSEVLDPLYNGLDQTAPFGITELDDIRRRVQETGDLRRQKAVSQALFDFSAQVAHDIRSPLAVLETASLEMSGIPEAQRVLIHGAARHMSDIANSLLSRYPTLENMPQPSAMKTASPGKLATTTHQLAALIDSVAREKRLQYGSRRSVKIEARLTRDSYRIFSRIEPIDFKRVLSNLINNAVEALPEVGGRVDIHLASKDGEALTWVQDTGVGIPADLLAKLGTRGRSHGKRRGAGLGLAHARSCAKDWGGRLDLASTLGKGTTATIAIPLSRVPAWFVPEIMLDRGAAVVVLDDDPSIHRIWDDRIRQASAGGRPIAVVHALSPEDLRDWIGANRQRALGALYLLDHRLAGSSETGLDLAKTLGMPESTVLVTSSYDDSSIVRRCIEMKVRMLPKSLAHVIPMTVQDKPGELFDAVLIDDDELVRKLWLGAAEANRKNLKVFESSADFMAIAETIDKRTPVYVDSELSDDERGEIFARDLHGRGFVNLFLATGQSPEAFGPMPWFTQVVGKRAPWAMS